MLGLLLRSLIGIAAGAAIVTAVTVVLGPTAVGAAPKTIRVRTEAEFATAVSALRDTGGTIVLLPDTYRGLVVPPRSGRPLRIIGMPGVRVESVLFDRTQRVSLGKVRISPVAQNALVEVRMSRQIDLHHLLLTAEGTRFSASVFIPDSQHVRVRRSTFTHCGDRSPDWTNCVLMRRWASHVVIEDNRFRDCYGCDFIHGRFRSDLVIRRNRFERALPCRMSGERCGHQDLIEFFAGRWLRVERNYFGVYKTGGAQLYLTDAVDHVVIVNNVFIGTDPRVPGYRSRIALVIGANGSRRLPYYVKVLNNTILTGAQRLDGYAGSLRMTSLYGAVPKRKRPVIANNVIGLLRMPARVCNGARVSIANVVIRGRGCSPSDRVGKAYLDPQGRPTSASTLLIDRASRRHAPRMDLTGRRRSGAPDIGAYELRVR
jgi:hypothetical protein